MKKMASDYVQNALPELLYEPAVKRLRAAQESGHRTLLLSGSPDFLVSHFAEALKVDNWLATPYVVENQRFSSIGPVLVGAEKCKHVKDFEREQLFIYSDSHLDLPLLELAGHSIAVNPSRQLRHFALKRGWEIL